MANAINIALFIKTLAVLLNTVITLQEHAISYIKLNISFFVSIIYSAIYIHCDVLWVLHYICDGVVWCQKSD